MAPLTATIKALLTKNESTTLDFKQTQYPFATATDEQKSEIIKDILSFANTSRHEDAYILIGITEGHPSQVTGITHHLSDADLQQLLHSKTNRPVEFSYHALTLNGREIAAIIIPPQQRPTYLKKRYGKLQPNTVYQRRGSSTSIATPDEIARMSTPDAPTLELQFANTTARTLRGRRIKITSTTLRTPKTIPDTAANAGILKGLFNPDYNREIIQHATFHKFTKPITLAITNTSSITAHDVRITLNIPDPNVTISTEPPPEPSLLPRDKTRQHKAARTIEHHHTTRGIILTAKIPKVQPHATEYVHPTIYLGARTTTTLRITATIHADNLPQPITTTLTITVTSTKRTLTVSDARKRYEKTRK